MGISLTAKFSSNGKKSRIVNLPEKDQHITVPLVPDENIVLNFSMDGVISRSEGDTLVLECPDGQCIYLPGAFADGGGFIMLSSGKLVTVDELLELQTKNQTVETSEGGLEGGIDRLGSLGTDQFQRNTEPRETPSNQTVLSQGGSSGASSGVNAGSGVGEFRSEAGNLVEGIWALPDQLTEYWGWSSANDRRYEGIFSDGSGVPAPRPTTSIVVSGSSVSESAEHIGFSIDVVTAEVGGCTVSFTVGGGSATAGTDYDLTNLEYYDGVSWTALVPDSNGVYTVSVPGGVGNIQIRLPLVDDALSEGNEAIGLTVTGVTGAGGAPLTDYTADTKLDGSAVIIEDTKVNGGLGPNEPDQKDGPVVSVARTSALYQNEDDTTPEHTFQIILDKDLAASGGVTGVTDPGGGSNVLLQDITISMNLGGTATRDGNPGGLPQDYEFKPSAALQALIDSGHVSYSPPDADGNFSLILHGLHDAQGGAYPIGGSHKPLAVGDLATIIFEASIDNDGQVELPESIVVSITGVHGNESHAHPTDNKATGMIADDASSQAGPQLSLSSPASTTESGSPDPAYAAADNTVWHQINLHVATPDTIRTVITLEGKNGAVLHTGGNGDTADVKWAGVVEYSTDNGTTWLTMPAGNYTYNPATGKCDLTIPTNATNVRFGVTTIDDLRETSNAGEAGETYEVTLELVQSGGLTDAAAVITGSPTTSTTIVPDARPAGDLNPAGFDGPFVTIEAGTANPVAESGGNTLPYSVKLKNPNGSGGLFDATTENVDVTLTVTGSDGFQIQDLFPPTNASGAFSGTITYQAYDASGNPVGSAQTVTITGDGSTLSGDDTSFSFTATLPPGAAEIKIEIPVNDDPLGGASSSASAIERLNETVQLEITDVKGNEARVDGNDSATVTITDDTVSASFEGVKVGLSWQGGNTTEKTIGEGDTGVIMLRLFQNNGSDLSGSPYLNYTGDNKIPEDLSVKLSFANTPGSDSDMALQFSTQFLALVNAGKVTVTIGGATYTNSTALNGLDLSGEFTVTLKGGQFDLSSDLGSLSFNAHTFGDNVQEFKENPGGYGTEANEQFGLTVTEVSGNESSVKTGADKATGTITDKADGLLSITGGDLAPSNGTDPGSWDFTIAVKYPDNEKTNHPGSSASAGGASGSAVTVPGEDSVITIRVTDGEVMENGQEYTVTAYDLFLSINDAANDPSVAAVTEAMYNDILAGNASPNDSWIIVRQNGSWGPVNPSDNDSVTFDLEVPKEYWETTAGSGGTIDITISQGDRVGAITDTRDGGFTVSLEPPANGKGEIAGLGTPSSTAAEEDDALRINMTLEVTPTVYENASSDGAKDNIATFTMKFTQFRDGEEVSTPFCMGREFSFEFTLRNNGSANLNENTDDNTLYPDLNDFALCDGDGNISVYDDIDALTANLQAILTSQYGLQSDGVTPSVKIALDPDDTNGYKFKITVGAGVDLSEGIDLHFVAMDNNTTDSGRTVNGVISNITCADPVVVIEITKDGGTATVVDETRDKSGFAIALGDGYGYEKTIGDNALDGNGTALDGKIHIPVYAYILSNGHMPGSSVADGEILSFKELVKIYNAKNPSTPITEAGAVSSSAFKQFVEDNFAITQDITITIDLDNGANSAVTEDYKNKTSETLDKNDWELVIEVGSDGEVYVYYKNECTVESIDDTFSMIKDQDVDLTITVANSANNETRPVQTGNGGRDDGKLADGHDSSATGAILDYHNGPQITNLGPVDKNAYEPNDYQHGPVGGGQHVAGDKATAYTIQLDKATTENMVVWLDITDNGVGSGSTSTGAVFGEDYAFGKGLYQFKNGQYIRFDTDGTAVALTQTEIDALPPYVSSAGMEGKYFVIIEGGKSSASFDILVKDDNKTEDDDKLTIKVVDAQGGEATYTETIETAPGVFEDFTIPWAKDVPYEYFVQGVGKVLVDPANNCYTTISGGVQYPLDASGTNNQWALKPNAPGYQAQGDVSNVTEDLKIVDDGNGPVVSIVHDGTTNVAWIDGADAPTITISMQDYCQEDVTITVRLAISGQGEQTLTLTMQEGWQSHTFTADEILAAWRIASGDPSATLARKSFDVQIMDSTGGETDHSDAVIRVNIREGTGPAVKVYDLQDMVITEGWRPGVPGDPDGVIQLKMDIPSSSDITFTQNIGFSVTVSQSDLLQGNATQTYTVTLTPAQLAELQSLGGTGTFSFQIAMNGGSPEVRIYDSGGSLVTLATPPALTGASSLPAAIGDSEIGDTHGVNISISGTTGDSVYVDDRSIGTVAIKDGTLARLLIFIEDGGVWKLIDGSTLSENEGTLKMKAALVLVDENGDLVDASGTVVPGPNITLDQLVEVTAKAPLEFEIDYGDYTTGVDRAAVEGEDYTGSEKVRIEAGSSSGEFTVTVTNDDITEGREGLNLSLEATDETKNSAGHILDRIVDENGNPITGDVYGEANVVITDDGSGPVIHWDLSANSVAENGELTLSWESFTRDENGQAAGREIVAEDVTLFFEITPKPGFTLAEIDSITVTVMENGSPKNYTYMNGSAEFAALITDNGATWTLKPAFIGGTGLGGLTITFKDDVISETGEGFKVELVDVTGSEAHVGKNADGTAITQDVTVTETLNGPVVDLVAGAASEETGTVTYTLKLTGGEPIEQQATVEIALSADSKDMLKSGGTVTVTYPDGSACPATIAETPLGSGKYTITLAPGAGNGDYVITFPIQDNAALEEKKFGVSLGGLEGGELRSADGVKFETKFVNETGGDTSNSGLKTLCVFTNNTAALANCEGEFSFVVSGMTKEAVIGKVELTVNNVTVTLDKSTSGQAEPGKWYWDDAAKQIVIVTESGQVQSSYEVTVTFAKEGGSVSATDLSNSKLNMVIENAKIENREVSVTIQNESAAADLDGPVVSVELSGDPIIEGDATYGKVSGTVKVDLPDDLLEGQTLLDDIVIVLQVAPAGAAFSLESPPSGVTYTQSGDTVTITIPKTVPNTSGGFDLDFTIPVPNNSTQDNPEYKVTVTDVHGADKNAPVYEKYEKHPVDSSVSATPTDTDISNDPADKQGPVAGIAFGAGPFVEGGDITGSLLIALAHCAGEAGTTLDDIIVTLTVEPSGARFSLVNPPAGCSFTQTGDTVVVTVNKGTNLSDCANLGFKIPVPDNSLSAQNDEYKVTVNGITGKDGATAVYEKYEVDSSAAQTAAIRPDTETNPAEREGPVASLALSDEAEEGAFIGGAVMVDLNHAASEGDGTLAPLIITLQLSSADTGLLDPSALTCLFDGQSYSVSATGEVVITLPVGTEIPSGGFEFSFNGVPAGSAGTGYTVTLSIDDPGNVYESCGVDPLADSGGGIVVAPSPFMVPLSALALFADEGAELGGLLETGLRNLAEIEDSGGGMAGSDGALPAQTGDALAPEYSNTGFNDQSVDPAPAYDEQALLMMKIMAESGPA